MSQINKLARKVEDPQFMKSFAKNKIKAIEDTVGRPLAKHEQDAVSALSHGKLKKVVNGLKPRGKGPHAPE